VFAANPVLVAADSYIRRAFQFLRAKLIQLRTLLKSSQNAGLATLLDVRGVGKGSRGDAPGAIRAIARY
jgi:hypothetical protein